jgi:hypothetical protein
MFGGVETKKYKDLWDACEKEYYTHARNTIASTLYTEKRKVVSGSVDNSPTYEYCISATLNPEWPFNDLYIDTIDYNSFAQEMEELEELRIQYDKLPDISSEPDFKKPKKENGEEYKPYCDKYFPMNFGQAFGIDLFALWVFGFFNVQVPVYGDDGKQETTWKFVGLPFKTEDVPKYETCAIAINKGYAYIPTGLDVTLEYIGLPLLKDSILIPGVGPDYGAILGRILLSSK